jgi:CubicO group peptidase (beta-lactamase class C family)
MATPDSNAGTDFAPMHAAMQRYIDAGRLAGVITAVMRDGEVIDFGCFGQMDIERAKPMQPDAIFRIYSNTKIVTSVAALQLWEGGRFSIDDPLHEYLPELRNVEVFAGSDGKNVRTEPCASAPTIRQLMSHSAGFVYGWDPTHPVDQAYVRADVNDSDSTLAQMVEKLGRIPLAYQPGTEWRYSVSTDVLARLVEVVSGKRFDTYLDDHIFQPLGMVDTGFFVPREKQDRFTTNYRPTPDGIEKADDPYNGQYSQPKAMLSGGGGLCGTIGDYIQFVGMLMNGGMWRGQRILQTSTIDVMRTNVLAPGVGVRFMQLQLPQTVFGLGVAIRTGVSEGEPSAVEGEFHWGGVAGTHSWISPKAKLAGLCFTQLLPGFLHPYSQEFRRLAYSGAGVR